MLLFRHQHSPVVRLAPRELTYTTAIAVKEIYGNRSGREAVAPQSSLGSLNIFLKHWANVNASHGAFYHEGRLAVLIEAYNPQPGQGGRRRLEKFLKRVCIISRLANPSDGEGSQPAQGKTVRRWDVPGRSVSLELLPTKFANAPLPPAATAGVPTLLGSGAWRSSKAELRVSRHLAKSGHPTPYRRGPGSLKL
ncbi:isotrichodermin c-15 hydroxylase [Diaporthe eres]|nr:isotrichodermin c-15 hydroxylase [Diaporthe eres]